MNGSQPGSDSDFGDYSAKYGECASDLSHSKRYNNYGAPQDNVHFKILVPSIATGAVIGKKGDAIAKIQKETGAKVKMSKNNDFYPGTSERVCLILGSVDAIMKVHDYIMDKILEKPEVPTASQVSMGGVGPGSFTSGELDGLPNSTIDSSVTGTVSENGPVSRVPWYESINSTGSNPNSTMLTRMSSIEGNASRFPTERHKQVKILVPNSTAGMIIGKGGQFIKEIKDSSGAYVQISQKSKDSSLSLPERCVIIGGERENNRNAVRMILQKIAEDPQSSTCPQISYADCVGPLPSAYPTGSPFAIVTSSGNGMPSGNMYHNASSANVSAASTSWNKPNVGSSGGNMMGLWPSTVEQCITAGLSSIGASNPSGAGSMTAEGVHCVRQCLLSAGYSVQAVNECSQALHVLSQYGLFDHRTLLASANGGTLPNAMNAHDTNNSNSSSAGGGSSLHIATGMPSTNGPPLSQGLFGSSGQQPPMMDGSGMMSPNSQSTGGMHFSSFNYQFANSPGPFSPMGFGIGNSYAAGGYPAPFSPQLSSSITSRVHHNSETMPMGMPGTDGSLHPMQPLMIYNPPGMSTPLSSLFSPSSSYNFGGIMDSTSVNALNALQSQWGLNVPGAGMGSTSSIIDPSTAAFITGGAMSPYTSGGYVATPPSMSAFSPAAIPATYMNIPQPASTIEELSFNLAAMQPYNSANTISNPVGTLQSPPNHPQTTSSAVLYSSYVNNMNTTGVGGISVGDLPSTSVGTPHVNATSGGGGGSGGGNSSWVGSTSVSSNSTTAATLSTNAGK